MGNSTSASPGVRYLLSSICRRLTGDPGPLQYDWLSEFLRKMRMVRDFQSVLHADCVGDMAERGGKELERGAAVENVHGGMNDVHHRPLVTSIPWGRFQHISAYSSGVITAGTFSRGLQILRPTEPHFFTFLPL